MRPHRSHGRLQAATLVLVGLLVATVALGAVATQVAGHAYLSESDPANGEALESVPESVDLTFSGDGVQIVTEARIVDPDGEEVAGEAVIDEADTQRVSIPLALESPDSAPDGMYTVHWEVLADDGHTTSGSFFFTVGEEELDRDAVLATYEDDDDDGVAGWEAGAKGLVLLSLVGLVGIPVTAWVALYPVVGRNEAARSSVDSRLTRVLAGAGVLLFVGVLALGLVRAASLDGLSSGALSEFVGTSLGAVWLAQLALAGVIAAVLLAAATRGLDRRLWLAAAGLGGVAVGALVGSTSHSATAIDRLQGTAVDFAHIAGAGLWVGGLLVLALALPVALERVDESARASVAAAAIRRYSIVALTGVTLALTTGLVLASWHAPTLEAFTETLYGTALSAKTLLVFVALGLGGLTRTVLLRRLESRTPERARSSRASAGRAVREDGGRTSEPTVLVRRAIRLEVAVLVGVLLLSALLTSAPTAAVAADDDGPETATLEREFDEGVLTLTTLPAHEAQEAFFVDEGAPVVFEVAFTDGTGERVDSDRTVSVLAHNERSGTTMRFDLEPTDDGTYASVQALPDAEWWELRITGSVGGTFVSEWVDGYAIPEGHGHDDHDHGPEETGFTTLLRLGAMGVGIVGSLAVTVETLRFGRRENQTGE
ncbi:copper resistance CopC/CopD family protein [Natronobiforma cellulositropha]|uniref:copper resistance CopC/CopD family protein n=1 Tax=Natronobiforma cellulositropha TaxID=1679076 RepID=UPI0021D60075|nr:copper resistance protein CopC/CopD [Natronobiforma cellulositropha]